MKVVQMKKLPDAPCKCNTAVEEYVSSENIHFGIVCSQQIVKQIKFIQEVVLPKASNLNASVMKD